MPTKEFDIRGFDRVRIGGPFDYSIVADQGFHITINHSRFQRVLVYREGDALNVRLAMLYSMLGLMAGSRPQVTVSLPELRELRLAGACRGKVGDFTTTHDFSLMLAGASEANVGSIAAGDIACHVVGASQLSVKHLKGNTMAINTVGASLFEGQLELNSNLKLKMAGASKLDIKGRAVDLALDMAGASQARLDNFPVQNARVRLVGASRALINPSGRLDADLVGASTLNWRGNPTMGDIHSVGASTLGRVQ